MRKCVKMNDHVTWCDSGETFDDAWPSFGHTVKVERRNSFGQVSEFRTLTFNEVCLDCLAWGYEQRRIDFIDMIQARRDANEKMQNAERLFDEVARFFEFSVDKHDGLE